MKAAPIPETMMILNALVAASLMLSTAARAQFSGQPMVEIQTVLVGDAGNVGRDADAGYGPWGDVAYSFRIGRFEVMAEEYCKFLNAVAKSDPYGLYDTNMQTHPVVATIARSGASGDYTYTVIPGREKVPIAYISWFDAARFANWMHNGASISSSTETGAYELNGAMSGTSVSANPTAKWRLPTGDEFFKAGYYKGGGVASGFWRYPTQSDEVPGLLVGDHPNQANYAPQNIVWNPVLRNAGAYTASPSYYGTFDQGGSLFEWIDDVNRSSPSKRLLVGGSCGYHDYYMLFGYLYHWDSASIPSSSRELAGFRLVKTDISEDPLDSDADGVNDYREGKDGTDPNDPDSFNPLSKGLVAYYPFDGNANDESGYGNNGVVNGASLGVDRLSRPSRVYSFDGIDDYIDAGVVIERYDVTTISVWFKRAPGQSDPIETLIGKRRSPNGSGLNLNLSEGDFIAGLIRAGVQEDGVKIQGRAFDDGHWHHAVVTVDGQSLSLFIDGVLEGTDQFVPSEARSSEPVWIGREFAEALAPLGGNRAFCGSLDDVRIYTRALTEAEVQQLYAVEAAGLDSDGDGVTDYRERRDGTDPFDPSSFEALSVALVANYPFDNSWNDESGFGRHVLAPYTTFEPGLSGQSLGLAEGNSQANYWNDPNNIESPGRINNFTFSVWMKPATLEQADDAWYHLVSAPNNAAYLRIGNAAGTPGAKVLGMGYSWSGIPGFDYSTPALTSLQESFWQHVVGVQQGVSTAIYVNGRPVGSLVEGQEILFDPENFTIGNLFNKDTFQGQLDEVRIYGRALSPAEVAALYALEVGDLDSDNDGLDDVHETNTGTFVSATDAGTDPYNPDTSSDGILDGEAVLWNFNPLTDHTQVLAFLRHATGVQSGRFALYTEGSIMDLNLGGVMIQKSGNQASVRFKVESKMDLRDPSWTDRGTYLLPPIDMPGSKGFLRIRAEQP